MGYMMTVRELKERMRISLKSAYKLVQEPGFPACRVGGKILVAEDRLEQWLEHGGTSHQERRRA